MLAALTAALAIATALATANADAAAPLSWSPPVTFDSHTPSAVTCISESLCIAVDRQGSAFATRDPTASSPSWNATLIDPGASLNAVSCAQDGPCVAVDGRGDALVQREPGASGWSPPESIDAANVLSGISCPTGSLCVAVDEAGDALTSSNPVSGSWTPVRIDPGHALKAVSCASPSLCVAVDDAGQAFSSTNPAGGAWHPQRIDSVGMLAVSCSTRGACVAVDGSGDALASANPGSVAATWSLTPIDGGALSAVSCASSGLCVAVDAYGGALASDAPAASIPLWSKSTADSAPLAGVSCLPGGFCTAVDTSGRSVTGRVPAPGASALAPTEVSATSATLAGVIEPNDAVLGECSFEYGAGASGGVYTQSIPCASLPAADGGATDVSAQLTGLFPNTTYHYRVRASSPSGVSTGADEEFATAPSLQIALVQPAPTITGTPAVGQRLTCHPHTPTGSTARLSYGWLRDLIPIPIAVASTYTVKGQDSGHHLQCQVTATTGGGSVVAKSPFVTIPVGGVPASVGETALGRASVQKRRVILPVICSAQASAGCTVRLRLTAVETLQGARVIAVAASGSRRAGGSATSLHHRTVLLASAQVHLARGTHRIVSAMLDLTGRRLLSSRRRFSAYLFVNGTVLGVIEGQLGKQLLTLGFPARRASTHAGRR